MHNTITLPNATVLNIAKKQLPFANSFKQLQPCVLEQQQWKTFVELANGRILSVCYSKTGTLIGAYTVN